MGCSVCIVDDIAIVVAVAIAIAIATPYLNLVAAFKADMAGA